MVDNEEYQELKVVKAHKEDALRGWVRINKEDRKGYSRKDLVTIEVKGKQSKLIRRVLGSNKKKSIMMDFDTRHNDGNWGLKLNKEYEFKIEKINRYNLSYYWNHPDVAIRISFKLGVFSLIIAVISLGVSISTLF